MRRSSTMFDRRPFDASRRRVLQGAGVAVGLPLLDAFTPRRAAAQAGVKPGYAVFIVGMNGVQQAGAYNEPERFWPSRTGALTRASMQADSGRATSELADHAERLLLVRGIHFAFPGNGCGHSGGGNQVLTAARVSDDPSRNRSLAMGESVDHRISQALTQREPLALYAGPKYGYINDHVSHRAAKNVIVAESNPWTAYSKIAGMPGGESAARRLLADRRKSVNDVLRAQIERLKARPELSREDKQRLDRHFSSIRDIEVGLTATELPAAKVSELRAIDGQHRNQDRRLQVLQLQFDIIAFALASGHARVAFLQHGDGTDGISYTIDGQRLPNHHHVSHRIHSDTNVGDPIPGADMMHHRIDRLQMREFKKLLDKLAAVSTPEGNLLDLGYAVWTNQIATGSHSYNNVPYLIAGRAGGYLRTGRFVDLPRTTNNRLLNTLINAAGVRGPGGALVENFGDPSLQRGQIADLVA